MLSPVFLVMSARNGSQMLFRLDVVSVEIMPKLTSSAALAGAVAHVTAMAAAINCRSIVVTPCCLAAQSSQLAACRTLGPEEGVPILTPARRRRHRPARR